jgi:nucleoside-diphosphate-sugar epimerase
MAILVVGATGILRPAVLTLIEREEPVIAVARSRASLAALAEHSDLVTVVSVDATDPGRLDAALASLPPCDAAIVYAPAIGGRATVTGRSGTVDSPVSGAGDSLDVLRHRVDGRVVLLLTSAAAHPGRDHFEVDDLGPWTERLVRLVLGWHGAGVDARWHGPDEVSRAALQALDDGIERVVGRVRPWRDRPG